MTNTIFKQDISITNMSSPISLHSTRSQYLNNTFGAKLKQMSYRTTFNEIISDTFQ